MKREAIIVELTKHLEIALTYAMKEEWDLPVPAIEGYSLRLGILIHRLRQRVPQFWLEEPGDLAKQLIEIAPKFAEEITGYDPVAFGFVVRTQRFLAKSR